MLPRTLTNATWRLPRPFAAIVLVFALFSGAMLWPSENATQPRAIASDQKTVSFRGPAGLNQPVFVYNNWSSYDELSDNIELTEALAMRELDELLRLRRAGVRLDYYMMDAFWFAKDKGYREWRKPQWPDGPDRWLKTCAENGVKPGLWFATNSASVVTPVAQWGDSLNAGRSSMCMFRGGFLPHFMESLQFWYDRGVRMFKFDFADLGAATPDVAKTLKPDEIRAQNAAALRKALAEFRRKNPDAILVAFNGFGGDMYGTFAPIRRTVDLRWLEAFDTLYCGDPRPSDVPAMSFWRSKDIYTDHMVRYYEMNQVPLERIDNTGFMVGVTGTCYKQGTAGWKGMLLLTLARGGWMNVYHGNLELIDRDKAAWFAKIQTMYLELQSFGRTYTFGGLPGEAKPYGFAAVGADGSLYAVVNPSQSIQRVELPLVQRLQPPLSNGRTLFRDAGYRPSLSASAITLGPEQLALVGFGKFAGVEYDLGVQEDVRIPAVIQPLKADFREDGSSSIAARIEPPSEGDLRVVMRRLADGAPNRVSGGAPPKGRSLGQILQIRARQDGREIPVHIEYDKAIWSGLSWAVGEIKRDDVRSSAPLTIRCLSTDKEKVEIRGEIFRVRYGGTN